MNNDNNIINNNNNNNNGYLSGGLYSLFPEAMNSCTLRKIFIESMWSRVLFFIF
jgi:hypothetical protein